MSPGDCPISDGDDDETEDYHDDEDALENQNESPGSCPSRSHVEIGKDPWTQLVSKDAWIQSLKDKRDIQRRNGDTLGSIKTCWRSQAFVRPFYLVMIFLTISIISNE